MVKHPKRNEQHKKRKTEVTMLSEWNVTEENGVQCNGLECFLFQYSSNVLEEKAENFDQKAEDGKTED